MTSKERINCLLSGKFPDKVPFVPAIYEHKAALIKKTPSEVACNENLLYDSLLAEYDMYSPDILTVGIDVYNIEPEAIGCKVKFSNGLEVPIIQEHILGNSNLKELKIPDPEKDGRMPLIIESARRINTKVGKNVYVCVAISGPFSLAASLMGQENILFAMMEDPDYVIEVLKYCLSVLKIYIDQITKSGLDIVVFDSAASPPMVSPNQYKNIILPVVQELFGILKSKGCKFLSYIAGGNTQGILDNILTTGANNILCDFNADLDLYLEKSKDKNILLRKNINPALVTSDDEELRSEVIKLLQKGKNYSGFILGTGILQYDTRPEKVKIIQESINSFQNK
jgi:uroporphyrinogen decarboxylase